MLSKRRLVKRKGEWVRGRKGRWNGQGRREERDEPVVVE